MAFEYVVVKQEFDLKEDANIDVLPAAGEKIEAECSKKNIQVESDIPIKISVKSERIDPPQSPDSSQTDKTTWVVPVKVEIEEVHPETFLQVDIEEEQESENENDETASGKYSSDDSAIQKVPSSDDGDYEPGNKSGSFPCIICKKSYATSSNLQRHLLQHQNPFKCQQCPSQFLNKTHLKRHIFNEHTQPIPGDRVYSCDECLKTFKTSSNLQQHKKTHLVEKPFECPKCLQTFSFKSNFQRHQTKPCPIILLSPKNPLVCKICDKVFEKEYLLKSHLRKHDTDRPFDCEECTLAFKHRSTLIRHKHVHSGVRPYPCPHCGKTFTSSGLLKPHLRVHTGEKPYKCEVCPKMFAHKHNMQRHMLGHEKIKHTVCDICHKEFPRESRLRYHMKTHVNEKFFICKVCPKRFSHKQNVLRHYTRKHPGKTYTCEETDASVAAKIWDTVKKRFDDDEVEEILG